MQNLFFYGDLEMHNSTLRFELCVGIHEEIILCTQAENFSSHLLTGQTTFFAIPQWTRNAFEFYEEYF